jgi:hypothetical protein
LPKIFSGSKSKEGFTMSSVRQKMAAVQKAVNKAEEKLRLGEEPTPAPVEDKVEEVAQPTPEKKAAPKKKAASKAKAKSTPKGKKS